MLPTFNGDKTLEADEFSWATTEFLAVYVDKMLSSVNAKTNNNPLVLLIFNSVDFRFILY